MIQHTSIFQPDRCCTCPAAGGWFLHFLYCNTTTADARVPKSHAVTGLQKSRTIFVKAVESVILSEPIHRKGLFMSTECTKDTRCTRQVVLIVPNLNVSSVLIYVLMSRHYRRGVKDGSIFSTANLPGLQRLVAPSDVSLLLLPSPDPL